MADYTEKFFELNPRMAPMDQTDYYQWLEKGNATDYRTDDIQTYLQSLGFIVGTDRVSNQVVDASFWIHGTQFRARHARGEV